MSEQPAVHELAWDDETVQRFWSFYGKKTHLYFAEAFGGEIVRRVARWLPRGGLCIDYGCGSGGLAQGKAAIVTARTEMDGGYTAR